MSLSPDARISRFGIDQFEFVVVDDVLIDPDAVRDYALQVEKTLPKLAVKVGYELHLSPGHLDQQFPGLLPGLYALVHATIGESIKRHFELGEECRQLSIWKGPLYNCVYKLPFFPPHVDPGHISSFIYLNPPEQCRGGTGIYRHVPTGRMSVVQQHVDLRWMEGRELTEPLSYSSGEWELLRKIEMKYNRLVILNSSVIHKIFFEPDQEAYGEDIENVRLALNNFFVYREP